MTFEIEAGGQTRRIEVRRTPGLRQAQAALSPSKGGGLAVIVDGRQQAADVTRIGHTWSLLLGPAEAGPYDGKRSYQIAIVEQAAGELIVYVNGRAVPVSMTAPAGPRDRTRAKTGRDARGDEDKRGPQRVVAPMPGRIVKVLVKAGDVVAARQGLVIVEAMKMENELRSPKAGTVTEIRVTEGMSVEANAVLVTVE